MTAPPWGHKPPAVDDIYRYWGDSPPRKSPRVAYWLRRMDEGSWHPTHRLMGEGNGFMADWLGVYLWEWVNVIHPRWLEMEDEVRRTHVKVVVTDGFRRAIEPWLPWL